MTKIYKYIPNLMFAFSTISMAYALLFNSKVAFLLSLYILLGFFFAFFNFLKLFIYKKN